MRQPALFDDPPLRVRLCRHGIFIYYTTDRYIGRSLDRYGEFSEGEIELFRQVLRPGMTVLDVGANIGTHAVYLAAAVGPEGRVHAFEPQRLAYQLLCGNLALNRRTNVFAHQAALGAAAGRVMVPSFDLAQEGNFGGLALGGHAEGEPVAVITLDAMALPRCDFIKIDVEGMEREVLAGAAATLARHRPLLYVENDREAQSAALIGALFELDYRLFWHLPPLFNPQNHFGDSENVFPGIRSINMLGIPRSRPAEVAGLREITSVDAAWRG